jgi:hypothetical protein
LANKVWPFSHEEFLTIPKAISKLQENYNDIYKAKHSKRLLRWNYSQASCILVANCFQKPFDIETNQVAALVLMYFNDKEELQKADYPEIYDPTLKMLTDSKYPILIEDKAQGGTFLGTLMSLT